MKKLYFVMSMAIVLLFSACEEKDEVGSTLLPDYLEITLEPGSGVLPSYGVDSLWVIASNDKGGIIDYDKVTYGGSLRFDSVGTEKFHITFISHRRGDKLPSSSSGDEYHFYTYTYVVGGEWHMKSVNQVLDDTTTLGSVSITLPDQISDDDEYHIFNSRSEVQLDNFALENMDRVYNMSVFEESKDLLILKGTGNYEWPYDKYVKMEDVKSGDSHILTINEFTNIEVKDIVMPVGASGLQAYVYGNFGNNFVSLTSDYNVDPLKFQLPEASNIIDNIQSNISFDIEDGWYYYTYFNTPVPNEIIIPNISINGIMNSLKDFDISYTGDADIYILTESNSYDTVGYDWDVYGKPENGKVEFTLPDIPMEISEDIGFLIPIENLWTSITLGQGDFNYDLFLSRLYGTNNDVSTTISITDVNYTKSLTPDNSGRLMNGRRDKRKLNPNPLRILNKR